MDPRARKIVINLTIHHSSAASIIEKSLSSTQLVIWDTNTLKPALRARL